MVEKTKSKRKKKSKEKEKEKAKEQEREVMILKGLVVDWTLPSHATLQDWLRQDNPEIRIREVVDLFPEEIFRELETTRRGFYRQVHRHIIPAYSLKLLPFEDLPKIQKAIEETREKLATLDNMIEDAMNSKYHKRASEYYKNTSGLNPKAVSNLSNRFFVTMIPLRLDAYAWDELLTDEMKDQKKRLMARYERERSDLQGKLKDIRKKIQDAKEILNVKKEDIKNAEKDLEEAYEPMKIPVDVATLRIEKKELNDRIKDLKYLEKDLTRKINRLEQKKSNTDQNFERSYAFARRETEQTEKAISYDVQKLWTDTLEDLVRKSIDAYELPTTGSKTKKTSWTSMKEIAEKTLERIWSVQPTSKLIPKYEKFMGLINEALEGKEVKEALEGFY